MSSQEKADEGGVCGVENATLGAKPSEKHRAPLEPSSVSRGGSTGARSGAPSGCVPMAVRQGGSVRRRKRKAPERRRFACFGRQRAPSCSMARALPRGTNARARNTRAGHGFKNKVQYILVIFLNMQYIYDIA